MKISPILFGISIALAAGNLVQAQDEPSAGPAKIIQITREWIKPGKAGMVHDRSEAAFVALNNRAKLQGHYVALNSMTGKSRALYITRYASLEAWENDNKILQKGGNAADLDRDMAADGELLDGMDQAVFRYDPDLSYHPHSDISHARYYELTVFHVKPGHSKQWHDLTKMYTDALNKAGSSAHWATYKAAFGVEGGTYLSITAHDSLAAIDQAAAEYKNVMDAAGGDEGWNAIDKLFGETVDSSRSELLSINPRQSYPEQAWVKGDPDFWKPKPKAPETAAARPAAAKPALAPATAGKPGGR